MLGLFNLVSVKEADRREYEAELNARNDLCERLKAFHEKYARDQIQLEQNFSFSVLDEICINIWDDFCDDEEGEGASTYGYVEISDMPDIDCYKILVTLIKYIEDKGLLPESVEMRIEFYDSATQFPILANQMSHALFKRWQVCFRGITHEILDKLVEDLKSFPNYADKPVDIYSES